MPVITDDSAGALPTEGAVTEMDGPLAAVEAPCVSCVWKVPGEMKSFVGESTGMVTEYVRVTGDFAETIAEWKAPEGATPPSPKSAPGVFPSFASARCGSITVTCTCWPLGI